jgi:hypothetical protein
MWTALIAGCTNRAASSGYRVAISQLRHDSSGRGFYDRKMAEGKSSKEAIRALKRRLSDVIYRHLAADARPQHS